MNQKPESIGQPHPDSSWSTLIVSLTRPHLGALILIAFASLLAQAGSIGSVLLATNALTEDPWVSLPIMLGLYMSLRAAYCCLVNWTMFCGNRIAVSVTGVLMFRLSQHIARLAPQGSEKFSSGSLKTMALADVHTISDMIHTFAGRSIGLLIAPCVAPFFLVHLAGWSGLTAYGSMLLMIPFSLFTSKRMTRSVQAESVLEDECMTVAGEWMKRQRLARMMSLGDYFTRKICSTRSQAFAARRTSLYWSTTVFGIASRWWAIPPVVALLCAQTLGETLAVEKIIGSIWYLLLLTNQIMAIPDLILRGTKSIYALRRFSALLHEPRVDSFLIKTSGKELKSVIRGIRLQGVHLKKGEARVLEEIDLHLDLSQRTAIVGPPGSGKSSLLALLSGQLWPTAGHILLETEEGCFDLREQSAFEQWQRQQTLVTQDVFIESSDIQLNIKFGNNNTAVGDDAQLLQSIYDAAMDQDIGQFRRGIRESLGENGVKLSGGQRQRLNLARAFYSGRRFLFLDDPISAVDAGVANHLWKHILKNTEGFVLVTHHLKYAADCDQVIFMEAGRIQHCGRTRDLIEASVRT